MSDTLDLAARLNRDCHCVSVDRARVLDSLRRDAAHSPGTALLADAHAHLVAELPVFLAPGDAAAVRAAAQALHALTELPAWHARVERVLGHPLPPEHGPRGGLLGLDFHLTPQGPRLIEINTNPGGALINVAVAEALEGCCAPVDEALLGRLPHAVRERILEVFREEWRRQRGDGAPGLTLIVDEQPAAQYLYPEFLLYRSLFRDAGWPAEIADPSELSFHDGRLWLGARAVDLVYNRLTDFALESPALEPLRSAYEKGAIVLTPHPRAHALCSDKRLLPLLADRAGLAALGLPAAAAEALAAVIPHAVRVNEADPGALFAQRKRYFFKPARGFGSKAAYDGDGLTRRVWGDILAADYVAQQRVPAPERSMTVDGAPASLKYDLRAYAYAGEIVLMAARLYRGQTTNFRTRGGGFAPVVELAGEPGCC